MGSSVFIVAAEKSGDDLGAGLISELKTKAPGIGISGIGGSSMKLAGVSSDYDISPLSILGFVEAIKAYPIIKKKVAEAVKLIMAQQSDAVVLIDSWGFMLRVAWGLRKAGYTGKLIKYVAPQVWAMREGRAKTLSKAVDHLLTIHSFDAPYFERHGLPVTYVGNPVFDTDYRSGDARSFRSRHELGDAPIISVWFGSRPSEIEKLADVLYCAAQKTADTIPNSKIVTVVSQSVETQLLHFLPDKASIVPIDETEKLDAMAASQLAVACSGTVTTQLAAAGIPTVVAYKLAPLTFQIARHLFKPNHISIVNIAANQALMPEFIQHQATCDAIASAALEYADPVKRKAASAALINQTNIMRGKGGKASTRAAQAVLNVIGYQPECNPAT